MQSFLESPYLEFIYFYMQKTSLRLAVTNISIVTKYSNFWLKGEERIFNSYHNLSNLFVHLLKVRR